MLITDQIGHQIELETAPKRIVSLVPSQTELLSYLGLEDEVVGITKFCVHPKSWFQSKTRVGGTKKIHHDRIKDLEPDLIIGNKEENTKEDIQSLQNKYPVWTSDIKTIEDAINMIKAIGQVTTQQAKANQLTKQIQNKIKKLKRSKSRQLRVAYLIWKEPIMGVGTDTYIHNFLETLGFQNALKSYSRYPQLSISALKKAKPDYIFLSSEPFPFKNKHKTLFTDVLPLENVLIIDGEAFSWYGSRMLSGIEYTRKLYESIIIAE